MSRVAQLSRCRSSSEAWPISAARAGCGAALAAAILFSTLLGCERSGTRSASPTIAAAPSAAPAPLVSQAPFVAPAAGSGTSVITTADDTFLDDLEQRSLRFFVDEADAVTGLMPDRAGADGGSTAPSSIASVGFGLTALCIGESRGWVSHDVAYTRSLRVIAFLRDKVVNVHGFYYHFIDMHSGGRVWNCELSSIDTAILMAGALTVRQHFAGTELAHAAEELFERVEWPWMLSGDGSLSMGWTPKTGFLGARWNGFNEGPLIYLLGMGSKTHPLTSRAWHAWKRDSAVVVYAGAKFMQCPPLFVHQYPQCWFDLRQLRDDYADYYRNSRLATLAQRDWCMNELSRSFPTYGPNLWGITASDYAKGYTAWGGPPASGPIDGTVVPCAPGGSLPFAPRECLDALEFMKSKYGSRAYRKYGFVDAFNPADGWTAYDVLGIDVGATLLMAENCRSAFVWNTFGRNPEAQDALKAAGFRKIGPADALPENISIYK